MAMMHARHDRALVANHVCYTQNSSREEKYEILFHKPRKPQEVSQQKIPVPSNYEQPKLAKINHGQKLHPATHLTSVF
jgi:hypothetical protein